MPIKKVVIHLGMPKAGSRSIQETLFNNTDILEKSGFRYLTEWGRNHLDTFHYLFSPNPVKPINTSHLGKPLANKKQYTKNAISKMLQVINTSKCETLILSGEYFHELYRDTTIENIKHFVQEYFQNNDIETKIIYIIRNPLTWMVSWLQQRFPHNGYLNKDCDFFETVFVQYEGIINLNENFPDSLKILKFEDACLDNDGFVEHFLKAIDFPIEKLKGLKIYRANESRCMEIMEFTHFIESIEPRYPYKDYRRRNPNRFSGDLNILRHIKGLKFDLSYQSKIELWERMQKLLQKIKESTGIDYTDYKILPQPSSEDEIYSQETIQGFIDSFPKLSFILQKHFLKFFEKKYMETGQEKFKALHFKTSVPWRIFNSKSKIFSLTKMKVLYRLLEIKESIRVYLPYSIKSFFKSTGKVKNAA